MAEQHPHILTLNRGSSSIKFALFDARTLEKDLEGSIEKIGTESAFMETRSASGTAREDLNGRDAAAILVAYLEHASLIAGLCAVGYRIVHGGERYQKPTVASEETLSFLEGISGYAPRHLPDEIALMRTFMKLLPECPHIACFDTAFHHTMPERARTLPLPLAYRTEGLRRYGFHGLSYEYLMHTLEHTFGETVAQKRIVLAHLGSGASLAAVANGVSIDTTMGFTPNSGIPMSTRTGDLDAGIFEYFSEHLGINPETFSHMTNYESGLLAVSSLSGDMEVLLEQKGSHEGARAAVEYFAYHAQKQIGALAAAMGGMDILVFTGGIGERSPEMRDLITRDLAFLGIGLDEDANTSGKNVISKEGSRVAVYQIPTDEAWVIARHTQAMLTNN